MLQHQRMGYDALGPGLAGATKEKDVADKQERLTTAQISMAEDIFKSAVAKALAQRDGSFDYGSLAEEAFKAARAYSAVEKALRPTFNLGGAL